MSQNSSYRRGALLLATLVVSFASSLALNADASVGHRPAVTREVSEIRECANRNRVAVGLEPLEASPILDKAADLAAREMARKGYFAHIDPQGRGPEDRVRMFDPSGDFTYVGENIAAGYSGPRAACHGWMESSGHRENILNDSYTDVGGGFATGGRFGRYYVQVFAMKTSSPFERTAAATIALP